MLDTEAQRRRPGSDAAGRDHVPARPAGLSGRYPLRARPPPASALFLRVRSTDPQLPLLVLPYADRKLPYSSEPMSPGCGELGPSGRRLRPPARRHRALPPDGAGAALSVNRRAPLLVDPLRAPGFQHVLASPDYPVRHPLVADAEATRGPVRRAPDSGSTLAAEEGDAPRVLARLAAALGLAGLPGGTPARAQYPAIDPSAAW